jgi:hypothetical protein
VPDYAVSGRHSRGRNEQRRQSPHSRCLSASTEALTVAARGTRSNNGITDLKMGRSALVIVELRARSCSVSAARVVAACTEAAMAARNGSPSIWTDRNVPVWSGGRPAPTRHAPRFRTARLLRDNRRPVIDRDVADLRGRLSRRCARRCGWSLTETTRDRSCGRARTDRSRFSG